jgi:UDP-GlcNAc:undecaprenyl-phosphate/decaprenyl-phosphate GlcNAc-1-phosphate transferase
VALALRPLAHKLSVYLGLVDKGEAERKTQDRHVPCSGGILILGSSAVGFLLLMAMWELFGSQYQDIISPEILINSRQGLGVIFGVMTIFFLGALDDRWGMAPMVKLALQGVIILMSLLLSELRMTFFVEKEWINLLGTLFWVILITNAFNLIDNMDGLCSMVAIIVLGLHGVLLSMLDHWLLAGVCWLILGPTLVFLGHNRPKAKIYLGDSGSLSLGFCIAMLCVVTTYYHEGQPLTSILTPILMMAVPLFDVLTVMIHRWKNGHPLMRGDRNHVSHRLLERGLSEGQVLLILGGVTLTTGISSILIHRGDDVIGICVVLQTILTLVVFHGLGRRRALH